MAIQTSKEATTAAAIMDCERVLVGRDPTRIEGLWDELYQAPRWRGGPLTAAISAIDIALWDILGQAAEMPIYRLMGGLITERIRIYGSTMDMTPAEFEKQKAQGLTATRVQAPKGPVSDMIATTRRWREIVGPALQLAIHMDGTLTTREAIQYMRRPRRNHIARRSRRRRRLPLSRARRGWPDLYRICAGDASLYATLTSNARGLMPPKYEWHPHGL